MTQAKSKPLVKGKPRLRSAPPPEVLAEQSRAMEALLKADAWTEAPNNPPAKPPAVAEPAVALPDPPAVPASPVATTVEVSVAEATPPEPAQAPPMAEQGVGQGSAPSSPPTPAVAPAPPPAPVKPWLVPSPDATHAYYVVMPKRLQQKLDFVWKRKGYKSAKEFVLLSLENAANAALLELGETP